jgi:hypothetical protein
MTLSLRNPDTFNDAIMETFNTMKISSRQKLVGSAAVVGNIVTNDYDLNEMFKSADTTTKVLYHVWKLFYKKFKDIHATEDSWITEFKCGERYGDPLIWNMESLKKGIQYGIKFIDCILQPNTRCKLDVVKYLNGRFIEISEIYYFDIAGRTNYRANEFDKPYIIHGLEQDREDYIAEGNLFKALKREYRILDLMSSNKTRRTKLNKIFNGPLGWLYYCISNLRTIGLMKDQGFRGVPLSIFTSVQQTVKDDIGRVVENYDWRILDNSRASVYDIEDLVSTLESILSSKLKHYM